MDQARERWQHLPIEDDLAEAAATEETGTGTFAYAKESTWILDYHDRPVPREPGSTQLVVTQVVDSTPVPEPMTDSQSGEQPDATAFLPTGRHLRFS